MMTPLVLVVALLVAAIQMILCFRTKALWIRLFPLGLLLLGDGVCWLVYASGIFSEIYGADFAAYIYGIMLALFAAADGLCWAVYGIVCVVRKRMGKM